MKETGTASNRYPYPILRKPSLNLIAKALPEKKVKNSVKYSNFLDLNFTKPRFFETQSVNL